jgi:cytochrome c553
MKLFRNTMLVFLFLSANAWGLQGDPVAGGKKSAVCVACHGENGNSVNPIWPKIAGQYPGYSFAQMIEIRKGDQGLRQGPLMYPIIQNMTDQDLMDLAAFYATQTMTAGEAQSTSVALGEQIYRGGNLNSGVSACAACHGPDGMGNEAAKFPRVAGQHAEYLAIQLKNFASGARKNSPNQMMHDIAKRMSEEEINAVSQYMSGLYLPSKVDSGAK